jgi:elongation factor P
VHIGYNPARHFQNQENLQFMIDVNDLRKGVTFEEDGNLYKVLDYSHNKPGRGNATIRVKARNLRTGSITDKTWNSGVRVQDVRLDFHNVQFLYKDGDNYVFMDQETFEQPSLSSDVLGDAAGYMKGGMDVKLTYYGEEPLDVELPTSVDLEVVKSEIAIRGDTATGVNKTVTTETGLQVQVPAFVSQGDVIRVDTRTGTYITRA